MKNLVFLSVILLQSVAIAQLPVTDVAANANLTAVNSHLSAANLTLNELIAIQTTAKGESVQTTSNTLKTLKESEKMTKMFEKVSGAITKLDIIYSIRDKKDQMTTLMAHFQGALHRSGMNSSNKQTYINKVTDMFNDIRPLLQIMNQVLQDGAFKANDSERLKIIMDINDKLTDQLENLQAFAYNTAIMSGIDLEVQSVKN